jgi:hypothetical protein
MATGKANQTILMAIGPLSISKCDAPFLLIYWFIIYFAGANLALFG